MAPERFNEEDKSNEKADICEFCVVAEQEKKDRLIGQSGCNCKGPDQFLPEHWGKKKRPSFSDIN